MRAGHPAGAIRSEQRRAEACAAAARVPRNAAVRQAVLAAVSATVAVRVLGIHRARGEAPRTRYADLAEHVRPAAPAPPTAPHVPGQAP
ncbi:hypothetical protein [Streptomyces sp. NBC_01334]|uniref:hypothetical protein n=1 Tax=Streptomyces sp. NBC_01334 TaxID=2903827 RepID=UPI002E113930|nr:hypothetical protein OG736_03370 [Streptomyces sp. NBC_01334]